jgi:tetratricopeptide (TPR) repeat protein
MLQHFALSPLYTMVRFGMWEEVLAEPVPAEDLPFMRAISHMARGLAYASTRRLAEAEKELAAMTPFLKDGTLPTMWISSANVASSIVALAHEVLQGEIATKRRRVATAAEHFSRAVALERDLTYMEPPDWPLPVRQLQGAALLELGRVAEAEVAFRGDLRTFPDNGWSLSGLQASLERQKKQAEAAEMKARLARAWAGADITVVAGRPQPLTTAKTAP